MTRRTKKKRRQAANRYLLGWLMHALAREGVRAFLEWLLS